MQRLGRSVMQTTASPAQARQVLRKLGVERITVQPTAAASHGLTRGFADLSGVVETDLTGSVHDGLAITQTVGHHELAHFRLAHPKVEERARDPRP